MKKILISAYACMPDKGSEEGNGWYYSSLVSQQGYKVWCLTRDIGEVNIEKKLRECSYPNLSFVYVRMPRLVDRAYHWGLIGLYFHYLYWQWSAMKKAKQLNKIHSFDLIHHVSYTSLQMGSFMYLLKRPFIYGPVGGGQEAPRQMRQYFRKYWIKEQMRSAVSTLMLRFNPGCYKSVRLADFVLVWNKDTQKMAKTLGRNANLFMEIGGVGQQFIPSQPTTRPPHNQLNLVWVGRLMPRKALELSLHGLSKVDPKVPVHLTVVGDGEMGAYVDEYIAQYGLKNRVTWMGAVTYNQVKEYYRAADVFLFTSLRDTGPAQLIEAMGYSLPVITLNLHGQAELVSDETGIRVAVTDPETVAAELGKAIAWMYYHESERLRMGENAFAFAHEHQWEHRVDTIISTYYRRVFGERTQPVLS